MGLDIGLIQIMAVVGGNQRNRQSMVHFQKTAVDDLLIRDAVILNFEKKLILPKQVDKKLCSFVGFFNVAFSY